MSGDDPKRLLDDALASGSGANDPLRDLLRAGRSEVPTEAQMIALAAKIGVLGGLGGAGAAGAIGGGGGGAAGGAAGAGGASAKAAAVGGAAAKAGLAIKVGSAVVVATAATASVAVVATRTREAETPKAPVGLVATTTMTTTTSSSIASSSHANAADTTTLLPLDTAPSASASSSAKPRAPLPEEGTEAEVRLLERAQDALRARPAEALALADDHARRFPKGMLVQEREVIAIEALVKLGRPADAKARAAKFKARFPGSSHTRRIDTLVGE